MRLLGPFLTLALTSLTSFTTAAAAVDASTKFSALSRNAAKPGLIQLTSSLYDTLVSAPRNYTSLILLTAMDAKFGCAMCKEFQPEYELLAKSWAAQHKGGDGLYITMLDFEKGKDVFMKLGLNTAPVLHLFPPTVGPGADPLHITDPHNFEFTQNHIPAEAIAQFIANHSPKKPEIVRPFDYSKVLKGVGAAVVGLAILKIAFTTLKPAIYSRNLWAALSLILILLFTSGHMFNHIRRVPYVTNNGRGGVSYIAGGFSNQFGLETQIIAVLCKSLLGKTERGGMLTF